MTSRARGILNSRALDNLNSAAAPSGVTLSITKAGSKFTAIVTGEAVQFTKSSAFTPEAGRLVIAKGENYIPEYTLGIGASPGSGYNVLSDGIFQVDAVVACSGVQIELFTGSVLVAGIQASGTECFAPAVSGVGGGTAAVKIIGLVHATIGQNINVAVKSLHGDITIIGNEDIVLGPAATLRVIQVPSTELSFEES